MPAITYRGFNGGEIDPALHSDIELIQRQRGVKTLRNFFIDRNGSASNRTGFEYLAAVANSAQNARIIPFILNADTTYILLFNNGNMYVYSGSTLKDTVATTYLSAYLFDAQYVQSGNTITVTSVTGIANQNPVYEIVRVSDTDWTVSEKAFIPPISSPSSLAMSSISAGSNSYTYTVTAVDINGNESLQGTSTNDTAVGMGPLDGQAASYDFTIGIVGHSYSVGDRIQVTGSSILPKLNGHQLTVASVDTDSLTVSGIDLDSLNYESGAVFLGTQYATNPVAVDTVTAHGFSTGNVVYITGSGMTEIRDRIFTITVTSTTQFTLDGEDGTSYVAGGNGFVHISEANLRVKLADVTASSAAAPTESDPHIISYGTVTGAVEFNIYKQDSAGTWGYIGTSTETDFYDTGITADVSRRPPVDTLEFFNSDDYPAAVGRYQNRLLVGNTESNTELLKLSQTNRSDIFTPSSPVVAGSAFSFALDGRQTNAVKHILDVNGLVVMTEGGEWVIAGDQNGSITPSSPNPRQGSYNGSSKVRPLVIDTNAIYVQNTNSSIRDLRFEFENNGYTGRDLIEFASHLFKGTTVKDWCYQSTPNNNIWACLEDGTAVVLTYIPERGLIAWGTVDTLGGTIESLACIPEDGADRVYAIVNRTIDGSTVRHLERMADRNLSDLDDTDTVFLDSYKTYDGRNTAATTLTVSGAGFSANTEVTITASVSYFVAGDVGKHLHLRSTSTAFNNATGKSVDTVTEIVIVINAYTSGTVVTGYAETDIPAALQATATSDWGKAINVVTDLDHLEAETVCCVGDGNFINGFEEDGTTAITAMTVASGQITIPNDEFYEVIHTGLLYYSDLETLPIDVPDESILDLKKRTNKCNLLVTESKDCHTGQTFNANMKKTVATISNGKDLDSGQLVIRIPSRHDKEGLLAVRMKEAKPLTLTGVILSGSIERGE